ncbi:MAG TPA: hypothetical protein DCM07_14545 [Planctomycetaceae bacterium]|nr:hypothetical protein [Gimesia sp.]HAH46041.1 hypothetical protein [Planctomycetaceae bacterium]HBL42769.1 hypothetical protein [Planctomycetaceae bacterium]
MNQDKNEWMKSIERDHGVTTHVAGGRLHSNCYQQQIPVCCAKNCRGNPNDDQNNLALMFMC